MEFLIAILAAADGANPIWSALTEWVWPLLAFFLGLGLMVVVHEFGHFIVAKAVGIKVERFAVGFGPRLFGVVKGDTDYCVNAIPFGGYVKMLGQEDLRPLEEIDAADRDGRSFRFKSVSARMAVISAGVVMNALLAIVLFAIVAMVGTQAPAPIVGEVRKHFPAAEARIVWEPSAPGTPATAEQATQPGAATQPAESTGLKPGDRITRIEGDSLLLAILGNEVTRFDPLTILVATADRNQRFTLTVERQVNGRTLLGRAEMGLRLGTFEDGARRLSFGIRPATDVVVRSTETDYRISETVNPFRDGDRVLTVAGRKVRYPWEIGEILAGLSGPTVPVTVRRDGNEVTLTAPRILESDRGVIFLADGTKLDAGDYTIERRKNDDKGKELVFEPLDGGEKLTRLEKDVTFARGEEVLDILGMTPPLRVTAVAAGTAAEAAGLEAGDVIVQYGDTPLPTKKQLHAISDAVAGRKEEDERQTQIVVDRGGKRMGAATVRPRWDRKAKAALIGFTPHVDLSGTAVAGVRAGSPAAAAGIQSGFVIEKVNDRPVRSWLAVFDALKDLQGREATLTVRTSPRPDAEARTVPLGKLAPRDFDVRDYEFTILPGAGMGFFEPVMVTVRSDNLGGAVLWGIRETAVFIVSTYATFRSWFQGSVSGGDFMGPVGIGAVAVTAARMGIVRLTYVMALISAILAVMNFLPFPVLDGGHAVLLIIEKIRGKPISVKVINILQLGGLIVIALVFLALTWQDIMRVFG